MTPDSKDHSSRAAKRPEEEESRARFLLEEQRRRDMAEARRAVEQGATVKFPAEPSRLSPKAQARAGFGRQGAVDDSAVDDSAVDDSVVERRGESRLARLGAAALRHMPGRSGAADITRGAEGVSDAATAATEPKRVTKEDVKTSSERFDELLKTMEKKARARARQEDGHEDLRREGEALLAAGKAKRQAEAEARYKSLQMPRPTGDGTFYYPLPEAAAIPKEVNNLVTCLAAQRIDTLSINFRNLQQEGTREQAEFILQLLSALNQQRMKLVILVGEPVGTSQEMYTFLYELTGMGLETPEVFLGVQNYASRADVYREAIYPTKAEVLLDSNVSRKERAQESTDSRRRPTKKLCFLIDSAVGDTSKSVTANIEADAHIAISKHNPEFAPSFKLSRETCKTVESMIAESVTRKAEETFTARGDAGAAAAALRPILASPVAPPPTRESTV